MIGFLVDVERLVVWLSVRVVGFGCQVECDVEVVYYFQVGLDCDIKAVVLELACYFFSYSFCLLASGVLEDGKSVVPVQSYVILSVLIA